MSVEKLSSDVAVLEEQNSEGGWEVVAYFGPERVFGEVHELYPPVPDDGYVVRVRVRQLVAPPQN
jgi:hypothetical protein